MNRLPRWSELATALFLVATPAAAQPAAAEATDAQKNAAQSLFDEAKRLQDSGKIAESCIKLQESLRLYAASGTLLNLALCHERAGKTGSAYTEFNDSLARAQRDRRPEREQIARVHLTALAPKVSRLTVTVAAGADVDDLEVTLDEVPWRRPSWGVATIVDPGEHVVVARGPHKTTWTKTVTVGASEQGAVEVPPLAVERVASAPLAPGPAPAIAAFPAAPPTPLPEPPVAAPPTGGGQRTLGVVLGAAGGAGLAAGLVFALLAQGKWSTAKNDCPGSLCPDGATRAKDSGATGLADAATVAFVVGGAALAGGAILYFTAPSAAVHVGLSPLPGGATATMGAAW